MAFFSGQHEVIGSLLIVPLVTNHTLIYTHNQI